MHLTFSFATVAVFLVLSGIVSAEPPQVATVPPRIPAEERKAFHLPPGFEAQLVAAEPDIQKPMNIAFDAKGRLWVTCSVEYPFPAAEGKGRDTVKVLSDFGPDGKARKVETFADGLNIPMGILPYQDGAIVYSIPNLWRLRDTDGDGKCDKREVLYSGFGHKDTHGMVNGLVMGFDGWVYCCHGFANDSVVKGKDGSEVRMNSGNVFRVKPDGSRVELVAQGQVNPFGSCFDPLGNLYTACCHSKPITQVLRGAVYQSFAKPHDGLGFGPDMVHEYRGSTALCGLCYYATDRFPERFRNGMFLGDVVNNSINFFKVQRDGGTYTAKQQADFLVSDDPWFRPVDIKLGRDGALYVADFYNRIIGHYEVPLTHPGRDRTSGRIWRIVHTGTQKALWADRMPASVDELIDDLGDSNLTVRMSATQQLVERGKEVALAVKKRLQPDQPEISSNAQALAHALWVLERIGALRDGELDAALKSSHIPLRVVALRVLAERQQWTDGQIQRACSMVVGNPDGLVRRRAAEALGRHVGSPNQRALMDAMADKAHAGDAFLVHTLRIALREQFRGAIEDWYHVKERDRPALAGVALGLPEPGAAGFLALHLSWFAENSRDRLPDHVHHVIRYGTADSVKMLHGFFDLQTTDASFDFAKSKEWILALLRGSQESGRKLPPDVSSWTVNQCSRLLGSSNPKDIRDGIELAVADHSPALQMNVLRVLIDRQKPEAIRLAALKGLAAFDPKPTISALALRLADSSESLTLREKVAASLAAVITPEARAALLEALPTAPARLASGIAAGFSGSAEGAAALLDAVTAGKASPRLLQERPVQVKLAALKRPDLTERVKTLTVGLPPADAKIAELLRRRADSFAVASPDVGAGAKVYETHCASCHQIAGKGAKIGPQLDGIGARGLDRLLEDTLDPNRNVDQTFRATALTLKTGQSLTGLVLREEGEVLVLADAQGKEQRVSKSQVSEREVSPLSPMPANWAEQIAEKEFSDLMAYLLAQRVK